MKNRICELLYIEFPIIQGGMAWVAESNLAAAVSNAGGLGIIAAGSAPVEIVREEIRKAKQLTNKPFGLNIMLMSPHSNEIADLVIEEKVPVVTTGAGNPEKHMKKWKEAGIKVIPVIPSVALAKRVERYGADAIIAEGNEAGGHIGELTTMALIPQIVDAVSIPVIAAGGIADGRGLAAVTMLGASGAQLGTRFIVAKESIVHDNYKQRIIDAKDIDAIVTGRSTGHPVRCLRNSMSRNYLKLEKKYTSIEELEEFTTGALRNAVIDGDVSGGTVMAGQISGLINEELTCKEIIDKIMDQANRLLYGSAEGRKDE